MKTNYKILGMAEEGHCEHCGANCPKRRVAIVAVDCDGNPSAEPVMIGCICAAELTGNRSRSAANRVRQQAEFADQQAKLHREDLERQFNFRVAGDIGAFGTPQDAANRRYHRTRRPIVGSYFAADDAGRIVRVDGTSKQDVEMFASRGFRQITGAVTENGLAPFPVSA